MEVENTGHDGPEVAENRHDVEEQHSPGRPQSANDEAEQNGSALNEDGNEVPDSPE